MFIEHECTIGTIAGFLIVFLFVVAIVRAAIQFVQGFGHGWGSRQTSDLLSIFSSNK